VKLGVRERFSFLMDHRRLLDRGDRLGTHPGEDSFILAQLGPVVWEQKVTLNHRIITRWQAQHPDPLQLFSEPAPNG
jgi:hypothetical protein